MKKRLLAMVLAMLMLCTLFSFSILAVFDAEGNETEDFPWDNAEPEVVTYTVTLPEGTGYTVVTEDNTTVEKNGNFSFTVVIAEGYVAGDDFAVTANGTVLNAVEGVYTITGITEDQLVAVDGVVEDVPDAIRGDINGDEDVTALDALLVCQYVVNGYEESLLATLDINGDGDATALDALLICQRVVNGAW